jgi:hypothetical protein
MKKGRNFAVSTLFISRMAPEFSQAIEQNVLSASVVTDRLGLFDRSLMVPGLAAEGFIEARGGGEVGLGFAMAAPLEGSPAAGRELVDLCRSLT